MNVRQPAILAGGAILALTIGLGAGMLAVSPVNRAMAHAPSLTAKADLLPAAEAPTPEAPAAAPAAAPPTPIVAYARPAKVQRIEHAQYAQQAARDDQASIAWPDERAAPAPGDEPRGDEADGPRDAPYPPPPPPHAPPDDYGPPG